MAGSRHGEGERGDLAEAQRGGGGSNLQKLPYRALGQTLDDELFALMGEAAPAEMALERVREARNEEQQMWSGREDSNLRPLPPEDSALPG